MIILTTYSLSSCGPSTQDALDYFDKIISYQEVVIEKEEILQEAIFELVEEDTGEQKFIEIDEKHEKKLLQGIEDAHKDLVSAIDSSLESLRQLKAFNENSALKDAAMKMLVVYKEVASEEYLIIIDLIKKPADAFTESDNKYFNELWVNTINIKLNKAIDDFSRVQHDFAGLWNFDLEDEMIHFKH